MILVFSFVSMDVSSDFFCIFPRQCIVIVINAIYMVISIISFQSILYIIFIRYQAIITNRSPPWTERMPENIYMITPYSSLNNNSAQSRLPDQWEKFFTDAYFPKKQPNAFWVHAISCSILIYIRQNRHRTYLYDGGHVI